VVARLCAQLAQAAIPRLLRVVLTQIWRMNHLVRG
jgi:hypothetical protein